MADPTFLTLNSYGEQVAALQAYLTRLGYSIPNEELKAPNVFGPGTQNALMNFQRKYNLHPSGVYDEATQVILNKKIEILSANQHLVEGHIYFDNGLPASNITLKLYHIGFGGTSECLGETLTLTNDHNDQGYYSFRYSIQDSPDKPDKAEKQINLEIRGLAPSHNGGDPKEIALSVIKYKAEPYEVINLVAPTEQFRQSAEVNSEYKDLTDVLSTHRSGNGA